MRCTQCGEPADMHIAWLAKKSTTEDEPQECNICSGCLSTIWSRFSHTQFGQTIQIVGVPQ